MHARKAAAQEAQRLRGIGSTDPRFESRDRDARMAGEFAAEADALAKRSKPAVLLQRVAGRHHPPDLLQLQPLERVEADEPVRGVWRIERAAEKPNPHARLHRRRP